MRTFITGQSGRLGQVIVETFRARGDLIVPQVDLQINYMVFAHRYRGPISFYEEFQSNVVSVIEQIERAAWADGDRAIVLVSSVSAIAPAENQSVAYNLSKAALNQLARCYAQKCRTNGLYRINTVSPDTFTGPEAKVTKQQVADMIAFLCSPAASGINGEDVRVRG